MPKPYPIEFRRDVVAVARQGGSISSIARDFGITDSCLRNWVRQADVEDGVRAGTTSVEAEQVRDLFTGAPQHPSTTPSYTPICKELAIPKLS